MIPASVHLANITTILIRLSPKPGNPIDATRAAADLPVAIAALRAAHPLEMVTMLGACLSAFATLWHSAGRPPIMGAKGTFIVEGALSRAGHAARHLAANRYAESAGPSICCTSITIAIGAALYGSDRRTCSAAEALAAIGGVAAVMLGPPPAET